MAFQRDRNDKGESNNLRTSRRFPKRSGPDWVGPLVDYKEVDLLRKFMTASNKLMSRKRAGTNSQEQKALKSAVKRARFMALIPYTGP
jgi:small subunit ribosomal protein S18